MIFDKKSDNVKALFKGETVADTTVRKARNLLWDLEDKYGVDVQSITKNVSSSTAKVDRKVYFQKNELWAAYAQGSGTAIPFRDMKTYLTDKSGDKNFNDIVRNLKQFADSTSPLKKKSHSRLYEIPVYAGTPSRGESFDVWGGEVKPVKKRYMILTEEKQTVVNFFDKKGEAMGWLKSTATTAGDEGSIYTQLDKYKGLNTKDMSKVQGWAIATVNPDTLLVEYWQFKGKFKPNEKGADVYGQEEKAKATESGRNLIKRFNLTDFIVIPVLDHPSVEKGMLPTKKGKF